MLTGKLEFYILNPFLHKDYDQYIKDNVNFRFSVEQVNYSGFTMIVILTTFQPDNLFPIVTCLPIFFSYLVGIGDHFSVFPIGHLLHKEKLPKIT